MSGLLLENLGEVPNRVLRERVNEVCREIRALNEQWRLQTSEILERFWPVSEGESKTRNDAIIKHWAETTDRFNSEIRPAAVALHQEMRNRVADQGEAARERQAALDHGMLTGPDLLEDAARELDRIAGKLPQ